MLWTPLTQLKGTQILQLYGSMLPLDQGHILTGKGYEMNTKEVRALVVKDMEN